MKLKKKNVYIYIYRKENLNENTLLKRYYKIPKNIVNFHTYSVCLIFLTINLLIVWSKTNYSSFFFINKKLSISFFIFLSGGHLRYPFVGCGNILAIRLLSTFGMSDMLLPVKFIIFRFLKTVYPYGCIIVTTSKP